MLILQLLASTTDWSPMLQLRCPIQTKDSPKRSSNRPRNSEVNGTAVVNLFYIYRQLLLEI